MSEKKGKDKPLTPNFNDVYRRCWEKVRYKSLSGWDLIEHVLTCAKELAQEEMAEEGEKK